MRAAFPALAAVAALSVSAPGSAADVRAFDGAGNALSVGSVVATGTASGGVCEFADDAVTLSGAGDAAISLRADDRCRLVVAFLGTAAPGRDLTLRSRRPKVTDTGAVAGPASAGVRVAPADDPVAAALQAVEAAAAQESVAVTVSQTIYAPGGVRQYEDRVDVHYLRDRRTGAMSAVEPYDGYCAGDLVSDFVWSPLTEVRSCFYKPVHSGPDRVSFVSGGYYRQVVGGIQTDGRKLTETFNVYRGKEPTITCTTGGALPTGWYNYCFLDRL